MEEFGLGWALGGIALTALVTTVGTWFVTRYQLRHQAETDKATRHEEIERDGRYIAVRVVCILDPFVLECCDVVADDGIWDQESMRHTNTKTPKLAYPEDVDWRNVKPDLMYRILTLPNELEKADRSISAVDEHVAGPPDYEEIFEERHYQFAKLGLTAMDLARDIREAYGLVQPDYSRWDPRTTLDRAFAAEDEQRQLNAEMSQKLLDAHKAKQQAALIAKMPPEK
jgi:hypothetical protein